MRYKKRKQSRAQENGDIVMTYKDLSPEEFKDNVIETLANTCIDIAWDNSNFILFANNA